MYPFITSLPLEWAILLGGLFLGAYLGWLIYHLFCVILRFEK